MSKKTSKPTDRTREQKNDLGESQASPEPDAAVKQIEKTESVIEKTQEPLAPEKTDKVETVTSRATDNKDVESLMKRISETRNSIQDIIIEKKSEPKDIEKTVTQPQKNIQPDKAPQKVEAQQAGIGKKDAAGFLSRLDSAKTSTSTLLNEQLTPEKQAVFEILEDKLMSDVEVRIKKLKEMQSNVLDDKKPQNSIDKLKTFLGKEPDKVVTYDPALHGPLINFPGLEDYNEVERYWLNEPYSSAVILFNAKKNSYLYYVVEPVLSKFEDLLLREIKDRLRDVLMVESIKKDEDKNKTLTDKVLLLVRDYAIDISPLTLEKILYYCRRDFIYVGKIDPLIHDNRIEDVSANGHDVPIYLYHKKYTNIPTNIYYNETELNSYVIRLAQRCGKHISIADPMVDATMPDGSRIQMTLGKEVTSHGCTFTIRKFSEVPITPIDLINWNTFSIEAMAYLWLCIENNKSLIFAGGTASGKTSSLNAVSLFIPPQAKVISLEDTRELQLPHPNWIPAITRDSFTSDGRGSIDMYELLRAALRQRPEYLLVGEVRGKEALTLFQAMSTGHTTFSTMHADSVASAIHRLENPPISVPRTMIQALNIISIQSQTHVKGKRVRRNMKLVEITDIDPTTRNIRTNDIFSWDSLTDKFQRVGESKSLNDIMIRRGWSLLDLKTELVNRQKILEFMVNNKITDFTAIATIIHDYQVTPDKVLKKLNISG